MSEERGCLKTLVVFKQTLLRGYMDYTHYPIFLYHMIIFLSIFNMGFLPVVKVKYLAYGKCEIIYFVNCEIENFVFCEIK